MTKVTVFGQEDSKKEEKKAIELTYYIDTNAGKVSTIRAECCNFDNVCLLGKERHSLDYELIMAWNDNYPLEKALYLGHWNDGVVE